MSVISRKDLARDIEHFLVFKRALGHSYRRGALMLWSFERHVREHARGQRTVEFEHMVRGWLARIEGRKPVTITLELGVVRQLCLFRRRSDARAFVPGRDWAPQPAVSQFLPYIFSPEQVQLLLQRAEKISRHPLWCATLRALLLVLYCTGLRLGEAVRLRVSDVDLGQRCLFIRESKGKTRLVPFRDDLAAVLRDYLRKRDHVASPSNAGPFLVRPNGRAWPVKVASDAIRRLLRRCALKPPRGRTGPRPYDMRHTFAVHRLTLWYRAGVDIHARLPWLSAYMGHDNILGTEVYLNATPELIALAGARFERRFRGTNESG